MFAQTSLAPLRGLMTSRMGVSDAMLREVIALLAYENPMVRAKSCLRAIHCHIRGSSCKQSWHAAWGCFGACILKSFGGSHLLLGLATCISELQACRSF